MRFASSVEKGITLVALIRVVSLLGHLDSVGALGLVKFSWKDHCGNLGLFVLGCVLAARLFYTLDRDWFRKEGYIHGPR